MPSLMLRGLEADLVTRVRTYARDHAVSLPEAAAHLLTVGLDHLEARAAGGQARATALSPEQRTEIARRAAQARWHQP